MDAVKLLKNTEYIAADKGIGWQQGSSVFFSEYIQPELLPRRSLPKFFIWIKKVRAVSAMNNDGERISFRFYGYLCPLK
jgi:hypothetical protein